ncbi:ornithine carbamoyltransferase [bacterium]|nr:ornithine carbamoyltransferase [bacterium]
MTKDLIAITDWTGREIRDLFGLAAGLKDENKRCKRHPHLEGQILAMVFQKPSMRTRVSFEVGMAQLGGHAVVLSPSEIGIGKRESASDIARVLSRYCHGIMARLFGHDLILDLARHAAVPVINGLTDFNHPCQILGDLFTILEFRDGFEGLKVSYIGDGNNVVHSWLNAAARLPFTLHLACPEGYDPRPEVVENAVKAGLSDIRIFRDPREAVRDADVVYTDVWASMGQEEEAEKRKRAFKGYQVDEALLAGAKEKVRVMHCLPAHRGDEITDSVMEGPHSIVFDQAENRLHIQKAILVTLMGKNRKDR